VSPARGVSRPLHPGRSSSARRKKHHRLHAVLVLGDAFRKLQIPQNGLIIYLHRKDRARSCPAGSSHFHLSSFCLFFFYIFFETISQTSPIICCLIYESFRGNHRQLPRFRLQLGRVCSESRQVCSRAKAAGGARQCWGVRARANQELSISLSLAASTLPIPLSHTPPCL